MLIQRLEAEVDNPSRDEQLSSQEVVKYLDLIADIEAALSPFDPSCGIDDSDELLDLVEKTFKDLTPTVNAQISVTVPVEDEFEIDAEMIEIFASEAEDLLRAIENSLDELAAHPDNREALWEIRRNAHTLKGAAGIVGLKKASQLAHRVEDMLDRLSEGSGGSNETIFASLQRSAQAMRELTALNPRHDIGGELEQLNAEFDSIGEIL
ncbi:MAG: Hpt domain-containing protein, partial [Acidobacteriota bacterium]